MGLAGPTVGGAGREAKGWQEVSGIGYWRGRGLGPDHSSVPGLSPRAILITHGAADQCASSRPAGPSWLQVSKLQDSKRVLSGQPSDIGSSYSSPKGGFRVILYLSLYTNSLKKITK